MGGVLDIHFAKEKKLTSTILNRKAMKTNKGKGENVDNQHFLHFPQCFLI